MADRAFMYCPMCRAAGNDRSELMRDNVDFFCLMNHRMPHEAMPKLNPEMIKTEVHFKPGPNDTKTEVWINKDILYRVQQALGERFHPTMASIIRCCAAGEPVIVDGQQAEKLRKLGIRNGAEMLACAEQNKELAGQNEWLTQELNRWENRFAEAMAASGR